MSYVLFLLLLSKMSSWILPEISVVRVFVPDHVPDHVMYMHKAHAKLNIRLGISHLKAKEDDSLDLTIDRIACVSPSFWVGFGIRPKDVQKACITSALYGLR